jgi:hypothetical protein
VTGPSTPFWQPGPTEHLAAEITAAIEQFAQEDGCTPQEWVMKAARYCAVERLITIGWDDWMAAHRAGDPS